MKRTEIGYVLFAVLVGVVGLVIATTHPLAALSLLAYAALVSLQSASDRFRELVHRRPSFFSLLKIFLLLVAIVAVIR